MPNAAEGSPGATAIRPFTVEIPQAEIEALRARIGAARLPSRELVDDRSQGVQLATIQELARYWATDYDWRACEARLNALPMFRTEIDGADIHFIHVKSRHENALPLIMTHGWPGSVIELLETVGPLTDPARSSAPRAAGSRRATPPSPTSTRPVRAATSPPGKSPSCSRPRSGRRSSRCASASRWRCGSTRSKHADSGAGHQGLTRLHSARARPVL